MNKNLVAKATILIDATKDKVWQALITPDDIKEYMFGAEVNSGWTKGSQITWTGEVKGKKYQDKGVILTIEPEQILEYSHFSPLSGKPDIAENYHTVSVRLFGSGAVTEVALSQDNNADEKMCKESEKNWGVMLESLKKHIESETE